MPILTKEVEVKPRGTMIQYYQDRGYKARYNQSIIVDVKDLPRKSNVCLDILCDMCKVNIMTVRYADYNRVVENTGSYVCKDCSRIKKEQTNISRYGKSCYFQTDEFLDKYKGILLDKYGVDNPLKSKQIMDKVRSTNLQRYGYENPYQVPEFREKSKQTMLERFGYDNASKNEEIKEKTRNTNIQRYGVPYTQQVPEVRAKANETLCKNGTQKTSKQQLYLCSLFGGENNYPVKYYAVDICSPEEKIIIEYDGGGHNLRVVLGQLTQEEFDQKEIIRSSVLKREGYRLIKILSLKDSLPSDTILLQMLDFARNYFSTTSHTWITYDIDQSLMFNAEYKQGIPYNFGSLRTVKDKEVI